MQYALEGSVAIAGALTQWLRDNLKMIGSAPEVEELANKVEDNGGIYFVPASSRVLRAVLALGSACSSSPICSPATCRCIV